MPAMSRSIQDEAREVNDQWASLQRSTLYLEDQARQEREQFDHEAVAMRRGYEESQATFEQEVVMVKNHFEQKAQHFEQVCVHELTSERNKIKHYHETVESEVTRARAQCFSEALARRPSGRESEHHKDEAEGGGG